MFVCASVRDCVFNLKKNSSKKQKKLKRIVKSSQESVGYMEKAMKRLIS